MSLSKVTNVAIFNSVPGFTKYLIFGNIIEISLDKENTDPIISNKSIVEDDEYAEVQNKPASRSL